MARFCILLAATQAFAPSRPPARPLTVRAGLLKGLDPILSAELLFTLRSAGHGDGARRCCAGALRKGVSA